MRILCCLNRDLPGNWALNLLLPALAPHQALIVFTEQARSDFAAAPAARRELYCVEQALLNQILFPLLERSKLAIEGRHLTFAEISEHHGLPVEPLPDPNCPAGLERIRAFMPDLIVSIRYAAIFKEPALQIPRLGVLNLHSGILPTYRGLMATFRALLNGDREIGCTLHYIVDPSIDTGDIVAMHRRPVHPERSLLWHILTLYPQGIRMLCEALRALESGQPLARHPQDRRVGAYYSSPTEKEWAEFTRRGWRVADPSDLEQALQPYLS